MIGSSSVKLRLACAGLLSFGSSSWKLPRPMSSTELGWVGERDCRERMARRRRRKRKRSAQITKNPRTHATTMAAMVPPPRP